MDSSSTTKGHWFNIGLMLVTVHVARLTLMSTINTWNRIKTHPRWILTPLYHHKHVGYWMCTESCWILDVYRSTLEIGCVQKHVGYWMCTEACWILDVFRNMLDIGFVQKHVGYWMCLETCWILNVSRSMLDIGCDHGVLYFPNYIR